MDGQELMDAVKVIYNLGISSRFDECMDNYKQVYFQEEAKGYYAAVTRGQHTVCFIGGGMHHPVPVNKET